MMAYSSFRYPKQQHTVTLGGLAVLLVLLVPAVSSAELMNYFANATWSGSVVMKTSQQAAIGSIQYAVYTRAAFDTTFGSSVLDPNNNDPRVYVYQIFNTAGSTKGIKTFTVGLDVPSAGRIIKEINDPVGAAGTASRSCGLSTSAAWDYSSSPPNTTIPVGGKSKILLFTSVYDPKWIHNAQLVNTSYAAGSPIEPNHLPSPDLTLTVPEPASLISLIMAGGFLIFVRPRRSIFSERILPSL